MKSNIFLKVDFPPKIQQFFPPFSRQMHTFTTKILTHHLYHPKRTRSQNHHCLPCILLEDTDWSLFCAFSVQLPAFFGAVCVIEMIFFLILFSECFCIVDTNDTTLYYSHVSGQNATRQCTMLRMKTTLR